MKIILLLRLLIIKEKIRDEIILTLQIHYAIIQNLSKFLDHLSKQLKIWLHF